MLKTSNKANLPSSGFTLLEILIVLTLVVLLFTFGLNRIYKPKPNFKKVAREITLLAKETRQLARLKNSTYRIAFNIGEKNPQYWVEYFPGAVLIKSKITLDKEKDLSDEEKKAKGFKPSDRPFKGKKDLTAPFYFKRLDTLMFPDGISEGEGFIHFSPEGLVEKSLIQVTDGKQNTWSLVFNPITGYVDVVEQALTFADLK